MRCSESNRPHDHQANTMPKFESKVMLIDPLPIALL
jgi:hypothetical protein